MVLGELDDPETYNRLRIHDAAMVVVMNEDVSSTNIIFTIREVSDKVLIVTNADQDDSVDILNLAGSSHTFQFTKMLGQVLARRVLGLSMKANVIGKFDELLIAEAPAMCTPLQGRTLAESRLRELTGVNVVGVWEKGRFELPGPQSVISASTVLVLAGSEAQLDSFDQLMGPDGARGEHNGPVLVLGGGRVGMAVAQALGQRGIDYRVVEKKAIKNPGDTRIIQGSAADLDILIAASINETPSIIITTHDDDLNIFLTIYCRRLRPGVQIIRRASLDRNINTLHRAGANLVMSYASLCTATILNLLQPAKMLMISKGLNIFRATPNRPSSAGPCATSISAQPPDAALSPSNAKKKCSSTPHTNTVVQDDDELILIATAEAEKKFAELYPGSS